MPIEIGCWSNAFCKAVTVGCTFAYPDGAVLGSLLYPLVLQLPALPDEPLLYGYAASVVIPPLDLTHWYADAIQPPLHPESLLSQEVNCCVDKLEIFLCFR